MAAGKMVEPDDPQEGDESRRSVGVRDVARRAGVSLGTVSNVLNSPEKVGARTRARVERAISDLGFVGSRAAGSLRSRRSGLVGVVVPDVGNPYWAAVLRGMESVLELQNLALVVGSTHQDPTRQEHLLRAMIGQGVDGLLVAPIDSLPSRDRFADRSLGVVVLESDASPDVGGGISLDNVDGARQAVSHLLALGHRSIAFINGPRSVPWCAERRAGVLRGIAEEGLVADDVLIEVEVSDLTSAEGLRATDLLWESNEPTAVLCANDLVALGALLSLQRRGLDVPRDVSLVGYDDVEFVEALRPALTTVRQPSYEVGVVAAEMLLRKRGRASGERALLSPQLVVRQSTAPAPRS